MAATRSGAGPIDWMIARQRFKATVEAAAELLDAPPEARQRTLQARAEAFLRSRNAAPKEPAIGALLFTCSGKRLAVESRHVSEVVAMRFVTPLPRTPDFVIGLHDLRGRLLPVFDLHLLMEPGASTPATAGWAVVCGADQPEFLIATDTMASAAHDLPETVASPADGSPAWICGTAADGTLILDGGALLEDRRLFLGQRVSAGSGRPEEKE